MSEIPSNDYPTGSLDANLGSKKCRGAIMDHTICLNSLSHGRIACTWVRGVRFEKTKVHANCCKH
jgi:hypothetical protein